jgi:hypothetical protein
VSSPLVKQGRAALTAARKNRETDRPLRFTPAVSNIGDRPGRWDRQPHRLLAREDRATRA